MNPKHEFAALTVTVCLLCAFLVLIGWIVSQ